MRAPASATASSAMSSAAGCCSISSTAPASMPARPTRSCARELEAYGHGLADKPEIVALNKADALTPEELREQKARLKRAAKATPLVLSGVTRQGVPEALRALVKVIDSAKEACRRARGGRRAGALTLGRVNIFFAFSRWRDWLREGYILFLRGRRSGRPHSRNASPQISQHHRETLPPLRGCNRFFKTSRT